MQLPLDVRFHNLDRSPAVDAAVREAAAKLEQFADDIVSCRVTVEGPHKTTSRAIYLPSASTFGTRVAKWSQAGRQARITRTRTCTSPCETPSKRPGASFRTGCASAAGTDDKAERGDD
jgi:hypothetical protein